MSEVIGWIGVGSIGHRMSRHIANAGHTLLVADAVSTAKAPPGARIAASNREVAEGADLIVLSLPDGKVSLTVAAEIAAAARLRAKRVIDTSTIGIKAAEEIDKVLAAKGVEFVDCPVSGGIAGADKATLAVMAACKPETFETIRPLLQLIGRPFHVGPKPGQAQAVKLLNNFLSATALAASSEAIAFGVGQGIPMQTILDIINVSTGRNTATDDKFPRRIINEKYDAGFTVNLQAKDVRLYLENALAAGITSDIASTVAGVWNKFEADQTGADITEMYPYTKAGRGKR
jgi:3-hydroxyisobutyrate dehydrogenase-like beta-hydroxyacid dehydrogenase